MSDIKKVIRNLCTIVQGSIPGENMCFFPLSIGSFTSRGSYAAILSTPEGSVVNNALESGKSIINIHGVKGIDEIEGPSVEYHLFKVVLVLIGLNRSSSALWNESALLSVPFMLYSFAEKTGFW